MILPKNTDFEKMTLQENTMFSTIKTGHCKLCLHKKVHAVITKDDKLPILLMNFNDIKRNFTFVKI